MTHAAHTPHKGDFDNLPGEMKILPSPCVTLLGYNDIGWWIIIKRNHPVVSLGQIIV